MTIYTEYNTTTLEIDPNSSEAILVSCKVSYRFGYVAYFLDLRQENNPYPPSDPEWDAWRRGMADAIADPDGTKALTLVGILR